MKILLTGFDPFGGETVNPALEAVKMLDGVVIAEAHVVTREIPTVRVKALEAIVKAIREVQPDVVIAVGQAGGRTDITPERIAINVDDFRIPDNDGNQAVDEAVVADGPAAYWSTLPIKKIVAVLREDGIPASVSNTAGTFVCNHVFYGLMHYLQQEGNIRRGGFIHIPYLPAQAAKLPGQPSMSLEIVTKGLRRIVEVAVTTKEDEAHIGGTIC
ncbi:pyroglutamyl-peptidase I [Anaeromusa acidaminophila]|uniref:pyroglutamyl-peptidase I n=1 Tax=Anaeromusa acidaminophila TaxID=81464 RepID=UPI00035F8E66|nr:pyroglutamyl-peptidase I [Anaeromusa acidaminophila]